MKSLLSAFILLLLIHLIAAVGFVGWLKASDRLDGERLQRVVDVFTPTRAAESAAMAEAEAAEAKAAAARDELARLERAGRGPQTLAEQLAGNRDDDRFARLRLERLKDETQAIRTRLDQDKAAITQAIEDLRQREEAFAQRVARRTAELQSEDFKRAVASLESLPPKQAKGVIDAYMDAGEEGLAVDYLAAMQLRKSGGVLKAFKADEDLPRAALLIEKLRTRSEEAARAAATQASPPREPTL